MAENLIAFYLLIFLLGSVLGGIIFWLYHYFALGGFKRLGSEIINKAEQEAETARKGAELTLRQKQLEHQRELENLWQQERKKIQREEERIKQREDKIESRMNLVEKKLSDIEKREAILIGRKEQLDDEKEQASKARLALLNELEKVAGLSSSEAKELLLSRLTNEVKTDAANLIRRAKKEAEEEAEKHAAMIVATAINRLAVS